MKENPNNVLDQYFTNKELAKYLLAKTNDVIAQHEGSADGYWWLEPSVGEGCFFDLLPCRRRIGVDICPLRDDIVQCDYLQYPLPDKKIIVIGNPPFGHRALRR